MLVVMQLGGFVVLKINAVPDQVHMLLPVHRMRDHHSLVLCES